MILKEDPKRKKIINDMKNDDLFTKVNNLLFFTEKGNGIIISRAIEDNSKYKFAVIQEYPNEHTKVFFEKRNAVHDVGIICDTLDEAFYLGRQFICTVYFGKYEGVPERRVFPSMDILKFLKGADAETKNINNCFNANLFLKNNKTKLEKLFYIETEN